jgi:hypothetical protein
MAQIGAARIGASPTKERLSLLWLQQILFQERCHVRSMSETIAARREQPPQLRSHLSQCRRQAPSGVSANTATAARAASTRSSATRMSIAARRTGRRPGGLPGHARSGRNFDNLGANSRNARAASECTPAAAYAWWPRARAAAWPARPQHDPSRYAPRRATGPGSRAAGTC